MLGRRDNHYTTGTSMLQRVEIKICKIKADLKKRLRMLQASSVVHLMFI